MSALDRPGSVAKLAYRDACYGKIIGIKLLACFAMLIALAGLLAVPVLAQSAGANLVTLSMRYVF